MFHLYEKPSPPSATGAVTPGHAVDSSAMVIAPGHRWATTTFISFRNATASRFSRPPWMLGTHSPCLRL